MQRLLLVESSIIFLLNINKIVQLKFVIAMAIIWLVSRADAFLFKSSKSLYNIESNFNTLQRATKVNQNFKNLENIARTCEGKKSHIRT